MATELPAHSTSAQILTSSSELTHRPSDSSRSSTFVDSPAQSDVETNSRTVPDEVPPTKRVVRRRREKTRRQRKPGVWKKILWVKQSYPDNYTDPPTFLSHLQWNPRVVPYDFWPLVADSTIIVQHVCSVVIFICCFIGIYRERVSPLSVVGWGSTCTFICWLFWDVWIGIEERDKQIAYQQRRQTLGAPRVEDRVSRSSTTTTPTTSFEEDSSSPTTNGLVLTLPKRSAASLSSQSRAPSPNPSTASTRTHTPSPPLPMTQQYIPSYNNTSPPLLSPRWQQRLATFKSAVLIYSALLALSPILKSLTKSTTSDSIWAMSSWLLLINVFFYDYGGSASGSPPEAPLAPSEPTTSPPARLTPHRAKYQSSLSTNAALMASTVLASRLTSTTHVFSLTVFSIEVFGLFPVFRRYLRGKDWGLHVALTVMLIAVSGAGVGLVLAGHGNASGPALELGNDADGGRLIRAALLGAVMWSVAVILAMGGCSWWLISLQKYKNVVIGPWDPAKPIVRDRGEFGGGYG